MTAERAIIYVPERERTRWEETCAAFCVAHGYVVVAVVTARPGRWRDVRRMAAADQYDVLVCARRDHLPGRRRPRIEVVSEAPPARVPTQRRATRPRLLR